MAQGDAKAAGEGEPADLKLHKAKQSWRGGPDIAPDVRSQLHFRFQDREVDEVQQLMFLVANDGERAISNVIEPLTLPVPPHVEVLDASILHHHLEALQVQIVTSRGANGSTMVFPFPLLNKREFFVVKLLLSRGEAIRRRAGLGGRPGSE